MVLSRDCKSFRRSSILPFSYNQNVDAAVDISSRTKLASEPVIVQLGNSAVPSNNHLEALVALSKYKSENIQVSIPLAYGNLEYQQYITQKARNCLGDKAIPLDGFVPREQYVKNISEVDVAVMFHNRSQALGNCGALIALGKKLYIKRNNVLWDLFANLGIKCFDANTIESLSFNEFISPLSDKEKSKNISIIKDAFNLNKRLFWLKKLLNGPD